ncbi:hypothetical protein AB0420_35495 [Streptomyces caelestis]|uniref:hypothetical protein n=1 Tax=Streptomyces caelestis TaxID=36816 RepID=UPI00344DB7A3
MDSVDNIVVFVGLEDGSWWSATVIPPFRSRFLMKRWSADGEALPGRCFWCSEGLIVRDAGISNMTRLLTGLIPDDEFTQILQRLGG